jgi:AcrR family transcriptional regulator
MLNMRSISSSPDDNAPTDDRTTVARIRDAAIECFAEYGVAGTTARKVAETAGVSPGLVIHHFDSMDGLRAACDRYVAAAIQHQKQELMTAGPNLDVLAAIRRPGLGPLMGYLARVLTDDSPEVADLVDGLVDDAEGYISQGVESGMIKPTDEPRGRAVLLTIWGLGALVLHDHLDRLLGVDLTDPNVLKSPSIAAYAAPMYELYGEGLFTEAFAAHAIDALDAMANTDSETQPKSPKESDASATVQKEGTP